MQVPGPENPRPGKAALSPRDIRRMAEQAGFDAVAIAAPDPAPHGSAYLAWLQNGFHATMSYMERNASMRLDVRTRYPWVKSIIVAALNYRQEAVPENSILRQIASYAWSQDYHLLMEDMLQELIILIRREIGGDVQARCYVDTGAILERDIAASGGLGWIGKNTLLIRQDMGSYFFIGEILLDQDIPPQSPAADRCGSCTRCLDACPTDAFAAPYVLDAGRCIAYLNIEHKGGIPQDTRGWIRDQIFGCDICQAVCPWNRKAPPHQRDALQPRRTLQSLTLADLIAMDQDAFRRIFHGTPFWRLKRNGLRRNALIVAANTMDRRALDAIHSALDDEDPVIRDTAQWAWRRFHRTVAKIDPDMDGKARRIS